MTTTTVNEQAALANANSPSALDEAILGADKAAELAAVAPAAIKTAAPDPFKTTRATKDQLPYSNRELRTVGELLGLQVEALIADFNKKTGGSISSLSMNYEGKIGLSINDADGQYVSSY